MHLYGLTGRARGQAGRYICHDSNSLTQRPVLNTVAWTVVWTYICTHRGNQICTQTRVCAHKQVHNKSLFEYVSGDSSRLKNIHMHTNIERISRALGYPQSLHCLLLCSHRNPDDSPFYSKHLEYKNNCQPSGHPYSAKIKFASFQQCLLFSSVFLSFISLT